MNRALERLGNLLPIRRQLIVVAFFLPGQRGHHYNELLGYKNSAQELGLVPRILVPRTTEPRLAATLHAEPVLDPLIATGPLDAQSIFGSVSAFTDATQNLESLWVALASHNPSFRDILFFTFGHPALIAGIGAWLANRPRLRRPTVFFRIVGGEFIDEVSGRVTSEKVFLRIACSDLRTRAGQERVFLLGSNHAIVSRASRALCRRVFLTPLPKHLAFGSETRSAAPPHPTVYVHLNPKSGRFVRGLGEIIRRVTAAQPHVRFLVKPSSLTEESRAYLNAEISSLAEILPAEQDTAEYLANFRRCTVVLLAYESESYKVLDSGVFVEAVSCGKPVVVPSGSTMAEQIALGRGIGTIFADTNLESVTSALQQALREAEKLCAAARSLAPQVRFENSSQRYVDQIMRLSRELPDMEPRYQIGEEIDFSDPSDSRCFMREGWGETESWGVWSVAGRARLFLRLEERRVLVLRVLVQPFLTEKHRRIVVCVSVAELEVGRWTFSLDDPEADRPRWCEAFIQTTGPGDSGTALDISFAIDAPSSPLAEGLSADARALGIGLHKMSLS